METPKYIWMNYKDLTSWRHWNDGNWIQEIVPNGLIPAGFRSVNYYNSAVCMYIYVLYVVCICTYIYTRMYVLYVVCMYIYMYNYIYAYIYVYIYTHVYKFICCTYTYVIQVNKYMCIHIYICVYIHNIYIYCIGAQCGFKHADAHCIYAHVHWSGILQQLW